MLSVNAEAMKIVRKILETPEALGVAVSRLGCGATVIDMGQRAQGGWQAARYFSLVVLGGLGEVSYEAFPLGDIRLTGVRVMIDRPIESCVASALAGWKIEAGPDAAILSGPARALNSAPDHYFDLIDYRDRWHEAVITVQMRKPVTDALALTIAQACSVSPDNLYILVTRHASLVCAVQVAARGVELTMHRLGLERFDITTIRHASSVCVIPTIAHDETIAFGRNNDALIYGDEVTLMVDSTDEAISRLTPKVVTAASPIGGRFFADLYREAGYNFHAIPPEMHTPSVLHMTNLNTGLTVSAGHVDHDVLRRSFFGPEPR